MELSSEEQKQYSRHLILNEIGKEGQLKLKQAKVLVIGAGGLSCPVLQYLAAAGVGTIGIVDDDIVDQSNLQRQILYRLEDIGKPKVQCAKKSLTGINPYITINTYQKRLSKSNVIELFKLYDIIVDGTDNFPTRYLSNDASVITKKPLVFGSIFKFEGQIAVFNYENGPTYRCLYPSPPATGSVLNCSDTGVLGILPGIIGTLQANEVLKMILNLGNVLSGKLLIFDALTMKQLVLPFEKDLSIAIKSLEDDYQVLCGISTTTKEISFQEYKKQPEDFNLLDVRTQIERDEFHINGIHIPLNELPQRHQEIPQNKNLIIYCKSGIRSKLAIEILQNNNFKKELISLKNGLGNI